ncbi:hypothetical protein SAMN05444050_0859 [Afipia sp. GAS231]|nr:hypothetical protein SAMN05444050_0859 [Afipia sp. GAS231]
MPSAARALLTNWKAGRPDETGGASEPEESSSVHPRRCRVGSPVESHDSGAPYEATRSPWDQFEWGRRERPHSPRGRQDSFHSKPRSQNRPVQGQLPMSPHRARILRLHEQRMVGSCCRSAGILLPVECRSSSGSVAGLALTYQSPELMTGHETSFVKAHGFDQAGFPTTAPTQRPMRPGRFGSPASVITEACRTIERRLIRTLRTVEKSILRFRIEKLSFAADERHTSSRCDIQ